MKTARRVTGGSINEAATVEARSGERIFVKWNRAAPSGFFEAERDGLERLAETKTVTVPTVLALLVEHPAQGQPEYGAALVMAEVVPGPACRGGSPGASGGRALAELHQALGANAAPGLERNNFIGSLPQTNEAAPIEPPGSTGATEVEASDQDRSPSGTRAIGQQPLLDGWIGFFRNHRLAPHAAVLPPPLRHKLMSLPLEQLLAPPVNGCQLLHGDLWSGNVISTVAGGDVFIDPAVYRGHPEMDLAMTRLFGGFPAAFYDGYQEVAGRFDPDLDDRLDLYNLYPLLVHARLFGQSYVQQIAQALDRFSP